MNIKLFSICFLLIIKWGEPDWEDIDVNMKQSHPYTEEKSKKKKEKRKQLDFYEEMFQQLDNGSDPCG